MSEQPEQPGIISRLVEQLLKELGEDAYREGLERTPERVEKSLRFLTSGYRMNAHDVLNDALFVEEYDEMVVVKDIDFFSLCVPSKQVVNAVGGAKPARLVQRGDRLWTLHQGFLKETTVRRGTRSYVYVQLGRGPASDFGQPGRMGQPAIALSTRVRGEAGLCAGLCARGDCVGWQRSRWAPNLPHREE